MTPEQKQAFKVVVDGHVKSALTSLEASEHILALTSVLFALDPRAQKSFEEQLALEQAKNQKRREDLLAAVRAAGARMQS